VVADGASQAALSKWIEPFFKGVKGESEIKLNTSVSKYFGGEARIATKGGNAVVIAFPGAALGANQPEIAVLAALLGGEPTIKWSPGFSLLTKAVSAAPGAHAQASNFAYSDTGLFTIQIGGEKGAVGAAAKEAAKALQGVAAGKVSQEDVVKAIAKARFNLLSMSETGGTGLVHAGASLVSGAQPFQVNETLKALESVTGEKLKAVSSSPDGEVLL